MGLGWGDRRGWRPCFPSDLNRLSQRLPCSPVRPDSAWRAAPRLLRYWRGRGGRWGWRHGVAPDLIASASAVLVPRVAQAASPGDVSEVVQTLRRGRGDRWGRRQLLPAADLNRFSPAPPCPRSPRQRLEVGPEVVQAWDGRGGCRGRRPPLPSEPECLSQRLHSPRCARTSSGGRSRSCSGTLARSGWPSGAAATASRPT